MQRLLCIPRAVLLILALLTPVHFAVAQGQAFNNAERISAHYPDWMRWIPDTTSLAALSLPGTHDTMANEYPNFIFEKGVVTQSLELRPQLDAGIRVLDIRARHIGNKFMMHHGEYYVEATFDDVLITAVHFLQGHPTETILMRVKEEHTPENVSRSFAETFEEYRDNPSYNQFIWRGNYTPALGQVRGKIVILDNFSGGAHGINWHDLDLQDVYEETNTDVKWEWVRNHLERTNAAGFSRLHVNFLSAAGSNFGDYVICTGCPSTIAREVNPDMLNYLSGVNIQHTGVLMMDFPGAGLIDAIIARNFQTAAEHFHAGDYNGDGRTDWSWYSPRSNEFVVMSSNGQGGFTTTTTNTSGWGNWSGGRFFSTGDYNGDGRTDWSWYAPWTDDFIVMLSDGQGSFTSAHTNTSGWGNWSEGHFFSTGDYNGDGRTDWSWYAPWTHDFIVMLSNGQGGFTSAHNNNPDYWERWSQGRFFSTGDYNGDGRTDWSLYWPQKDLFIVMLSNGQGGFVSRYTDTMDWEWGNWSGGRFFTTGDYNGDGRTDWSWYAPWTDDFTVMLSDGHSFSPEPSNTANWGDWSEGRFFTTGDYNGDGRTDWSWYAPWTHEFIVMLSNDAGGFEPVKNSVTFKRASDAN